MADNSFASSGADLELVGIEKRFPGFTAVENLDLTIPAGSFFALLGPSGCGKTTTLRLVAGLEDPTQGKILIGGKDVTDTAPKDRDIAMVFQNYALYPHMSVADNMGFALKIAGVSKAEREKRVEEAAKLLDLTKFLSRKPKALSGGQRQRVAMGRAIVRSPKVFLMDEPLSNLDAKLRVQTRTQIASLTRRLGVTTVYVTHDQVEAMTMGDRVAVLSDGHLQQVDTPRALYDTPKNVFVAGFMGSPAMNLVELPVENGAVRFGETTIALSPEQSAGLTGDKVTFGIRPEDLRLESSGGITATADLVEELGADAYVHAHADIAGERVLLVARTGGRSLVKPTDSVQLVPDLSQAHLFDTASGNRLEDTHRAAKAA